MKQAHCAERIWDRTRWTSRRCQTPATIREDDQWWCWRHAPSAKAAAWEKVMEEAAEAAATDQRRAELAKQVRQATGVRAEVRPQGLTIPWHLVPDLVRHLTQKEGA